MTQSAKAQEPSMEEILASIRRIIADDESKGRNPEPAKPAVAAAPARPATPPPRPPAAAPQRVSSPPPRPPAVMNQDDIDSMLSSLDAPGTKANGSAAEHSPPDVLDLTESMAAPPPSAEPPVFRTIEGHSDVFFTEASAAAPDLSQAPESQDLRHLAPSPEAPLISSSTSAAVNSAFNTLAHTVLVQNSRTLEDLVREMMRPMLKAWLDDNLPNLVERVVRAEIERVSRGRSG